MRWISFWLSTLNPPDNMQITPLSPAWALQEADLKFEPWLECLKSPPLQSVSHPMLEQKQVQLRVLRTDLVHPVISGNKAYKLKFNLKAAIGRKASGVLSFGGAWSNHLHALAFSCRMLELPCVAVVRGEAALIAQSAMLQDLERWGCQLHFVCRSDYRLRDDPVWLQTLSERFPGYFVVPEGGSSRLAEPGLTELSQQLEAACRQADWYPNQVWCGVGTGGTLAGLIIGRSMDYQLTGVAVLKGADFLCRNITDRLVAGDRESTENWNVLLDAHCGGYGKVPQALLKKMLWFEEALSGSGSSLSLEPVYTGKVFQRFWQALEQDEIAEGSKIILIHTGGLQGRRGFGLDWVDVGSTGPSFRF